jgi:hypothetical protein
MLSPHVWTRRGVAIIVRRDGAAVRARADVLQRIKFVKRQIIHSRKINHTSKRRR